jgi:hypothetical protein
MGTLSCNEYVVPVFKSFGDRRKEAFSVMNFYVISAFVARLNLPQKRIDKIKLVEFSRVQKNFREISFKNAKLTSNAARIK